MLTESSELLLINEWENKVDTDAPEGYFPCQFEDSGTRLEEWTRTILANRILDHLQRDLSSNIK